MENMRVVLPPEVTETLQVINSNSLYPFTYYVRLLKIDYQ